MAIPLAIYLGKHGRIIPSKHLLRFAYWSIAGLALVTAIGTYERSALMGILVLGAYMWMRSKRKLGFGIVILIAGCLMIYTTSGAWNDRVATIGNFEQENSAFTRILVWRWTLEFTATHPFGGAFQTYLINHIEFPPTDGQPAMIQYARAFHSIYFEMLGEQGYPGLAIFLLITSVTLHKLRRLAKRAKVYAELEWVTSLSDALQSGLAVFMTCGAFVGIAFQPMYWYFIALSASLNAYMWRVEKQEAEPRASDRRTLCRSRPSPALAAGVQGWRHRRYVRAPPIENPALSGSRVIVVSWQGTTILSQRRCLAKKSNVRCWARS